MYMNEDSKAFFEEIKGCYERENRDLVWKWEDIADKKDGESILFYLAFNLSKNVMHGPLPPPLHNRMALEGNRFSKDYFNYLGS